MEMEEEKISPEVTHWLNSISEGKQGSLNSLMPLIYQELQQLARQKLHKERHNHTLNTVGLVNEAYIKLCSQHNLQLSNRKQFFAFASECMRRILVDYARVRKSKKRGGNESPLEFDEKVFSMNEGNADEICDIDLALTKLESIFPRASQILHHRLFAGLSLAETAQIMDVSTKTIQREWATAIAWLRREVNEKSLTTVS
jgi:RNA polymerase sigma factor (TIGR02999 family)